jgi:hypothetical protein
VSGRCRELTEPAARSINGLNLPDVARGRDCPGGGGGRPLVVEDIAVLGGGKAETLADR